MASTTVQWILPIDEVGLLEHGSEPSGAEEGDPAALAAALNPCRPMRCARGVAALPPALLLPASALHRNL
jgi:hypothetical protein